MHGERIIGAQPPQPTGVTVKRTPQYHGFEAIHGHTEMLAEFLLKGFGHGEWGSTAGAGTGPHGSCVKPVAGRVRECYCVS